MDYGSVLSFCSVKAEGAGVSKDDDSDDSFVLRG
jgi:hypothetical protein